MTHAPVGATKGVPLPAQVRSHRERDGGRGEIGAESGATQGRGGGVGGCRREIGAESGASGATRGRVDKAAGRKSIQG